MPFHDCTFTQKNHLECNNSLFYIYNDQLLPTPTILRSADFGAKKEIEKRGHNSIKNRRIATKIILDLYHIMVFIDTKYESNLSLLSKVMVPKLTFLLHQSRRDG